MAYMQQNKAGDAAAAYEKCVSLDPKNADAYHMLSACQAANNQFDKALAAAKMAIKLDPRNESYQTTLKKLESRKP